MSELIIPFTELGMADIERVGGKNASLGEMISHLAASGVQVPPGFATTAAAFRQFLAADGLAGRIETELKALDIEDVAELARVGERVRGWVLAMPFPPQLERELVAAWEQLGGERIAVAVRSSATAEDLPDASFAGQQETYLNVRGREDLLRTAHLVFASLFNDRAIAYRVHHGFAHAQVALSVGVQLMVRSEVGASGVMFTLDTESGFRDVVFITASYGLGEMVVQGAVNPDEFYVYKPALAAKRLAIVRRQLGTKASKMIYAAGGNAAKRVQTVEVPAAERGRFCIRDEDVMSLARQAVLIEKHYGRPMDIEWGRDGETGHIYILQARPETVVSRSGRELERFNLKGRSEVLVTGRAIGTKVGAGPVRVIRSVEEMARVQPGDVLVADMTDPDWEPVMKRAAAIVTDRGGRTCHAAIIARELGIPAVVGCGDATRKLADGTPVTVACSEGDTGHVYRGRLEVEQQIIQLDSMPPAPVKIMMNVANPERAFGFASIPNQGVGLARLEFIINRAIGIHPRALLEFARQEPTLQATIRQHIGRGYRAGGILCGTPGRRRRDHCLRFCTRTGDRALVGLQVQRIRQSHWRCAVRAARGKSDAGISRCFTLYRPELSRLLRAGVPRPAAGARRHGSDQCADHGTLRAHARGGAAGGRTAGSVGPEARRERPEADHDVRVAHQRGVGRPISAVLRRHVHRLE